VTFTVTEVPDGRTYVKDWPAAYAVPWTKVATGAEQFAAAAGAWEHVQVKVPAPFATTDPVHTEHSAAHDGADTVATPLAVQQEGWMHELPFQVLHAAHTNPQTPAQ
jgi:hypothetical protein